MNDSAESWSLPWHSLQSRVAERFGIVTALEEASRGAGSAVTPTANWLMRALSHRRDTLAPAMRCDAGAKQLPHYCPRIVMFEMHHRSHVTTEQAQAHE